jgi:hypothetical protein
VFFPDALILPFAKKNPLCAELKSVNRYFTTKGDKMFRSSWEKWGKGNPGTREN